MTLLFAGSLLLPANQRAAQLEVERAEVNVHLDPPLLALYARAKLVLRNRSGQNLETLELEFPAPLGPRIKVRAVWDRGGELPWRAGPADEGAPRTLVVALRSPLPPEKESVVVVSYDVELEGFAAPKGPLSISSESAWLSTTGWYPLPGGSEPALPQELRLVVRLPKRWQVTAAVELKQISKGTALASYELELQTVEPGRILVRAGTALLP